MSQASFKRFTTNVYDTPTLKTIIKVLHLVINSFNFIFEVYINIQIKKSMQLIYNHLRGSQISSYA